MATATVGNIKRKRRISQKGMNRMRSWLYCEWCKIKSFSIVSRFISYLYNYCDCLHTYRCAVAFECERKEEKKRQRQTNSKQMKKRNLNIGGTEMRAQTRTTFNENKKNRLPFVQQVVFQSLFHLEDGVPKVVHRHDSDVHLSVVPYLQCNNNGDKN